ncbi:MAG TPA: hypothetical protein VK669_15725 [Candidatus Limnocylindrales bacterium]|nr:hypothetical protein [Candidatus Limnocylindrales bacterium]
MSPFRGPVALDEVERSIGSFDEVIAVANGMRTTTLRARNAVGYAWRCGCEARGNASPFCVWRACFAHGPLAAGLPECPVPLGYEGGNRISVNAAPRARLGEVLISAARAIADTFAVGAPIGFIEAGKLVREFPDGRREVVSSI